jgi:phosphatidylglycerol lysyltransferase
MAQLLPRKKRLDLIERFGHLAISRAAVEDGLKHFSIKGKEGFIPYRPQSKILLVPGEPLCSKKDAPDFFKGFQRFADKKKMHICFFGANDRLHPDAKKAGYDILKYGEEAVLDVQGFTIKGNKMLNVRRGLNRCKNVGVKVFEYKDNDKALEKQMEKVSREWLSTKPTPELGFLMGRPELDRLEGRRVFVAQLDKKVQGFLLINPIPAENGWYADILRRRTKAPNGVAESLTVHCLDILKEEGVSKLYYGMVPFIGIDTKEKEHRRWNKLMASLRTKVGFLYPIENEYFFKNKFRPSWEPIYMINYPQITAKMVYSIMSAFIPTGITGLIKHKLGKKK